MSGHPVSITTWTVPKRLPKHSLCLSHRKDSRGKKRCLAVPEREADAYLRQLERFEADILAVMVAHHNREAMRPAPKPRKVTKRARIDAWFRGTKRHRHSTRCLVPMTPPTRTAWDATEGRFMPVGDSTPIAGWFRCTGPGSKHPYNSGGIPLHEHRTKRGRRFLVAHVPGDAHCPDTIAAKLAAESEAES